ncbi:MAG: ATP-binding cassette domain-containing protein [Clostridiales bacterium]|nr:ATP-binding cassette domain-containing protein [Clostridiales bacterium]
MNLIESHDLTLAYEGVIAAEHVTFTLAPGDYLCVVGENGSGKSTLLKAITGEVKPAGGLLSIAPEVKKNGIGYLPQISKIQRDFPASVREVVLSGCVRGDGRGFLWTRAAQKRAADAMDMLGVADLAHKTLGDLSGGQRQRVLLARAMCASDILLLLDEPVTGLDPEAVHGMYEAIRQINRERGCAVMMVSHDVSCALREAEHVLSLCRGHAFYGTVEGYRRHEKLDDEADDARHRHGGEHAPAAPHYIAEKGGLV